MVNVLTLFLPVTSLVRNSIDMVSASASGCELEGSVLKLVDFVQNNKIVPTLLQMTNIPVPNKSSLENAILLG